jgi:hypothetical protein
VNWGYIKLVPNYAAFGWNFCRGWALINRRDACMISKKSKKATIGTKSRLIEKIH